METTQPLFIPVIRGTTRMGCGGQKAALLLVENNRNQNGEGLENFS
jgi:hypothetical protein